MTCCVHEALCVRIVPQMLWSDHINVFHRLWIHAKGVESSYFIFFSCILLAVVLCLFLSVLVHQVRRPKRGHGSLHGCFPGHPVEDVGMFLWNGGIFSGNDTC